MNPSRSTLRLTRRKLLQRAGLLCTGVVGVGSYKNELNKIKIERINLYLPNLPSAFDGFRIAQISDIHIEGGNMRQHFPQIADSVTAQKADCIVLTGDYISSHCNDYHWQEKPLIEGFNRLKAKTGIFAVLGNHDHWSIQGDETPTIAVRRALKHAGILELRNSGYPIKYKNAELWLGGIDDSGTGYADFPALLNHIPSNAFAILLAHQPDFVKTVSKSKRFALMLSGHSHGGQISLPLIGAPLLPLGGKKYPRGLYHVEGMQLYTNRGLGVVKLPLRLGSIPEITIFTLRRVNSTYSNDLEH